MNAFAQDERVTRNRINLLCVRFHFFSCTFIFFCCLRFVFDDKQTHKRIFLFVFSLFFFYPFLDFINLSSLVLIVNAVNSLPITRKVQILNFVFFHTDMHTPTTNMPFYKIYFDFFFALKIILFVSYF